ncbi:MAG TPA: SLATT domain-containing protein [Vicinamibacterales bacterium]|nr:SLATT domain-containing protein [Vicinamibacterales bacterium]
MFSLSVVEHVRMNYSLAVQNYTTHARAAERLAALALKCRIAVLAVFATATAAIIVSLFRPGREYQIAAAVLASLALAGQIFLVAWGVESRVYAHRAFAHRLWLVCERYRSLLAEIRDGLVDEAAILRRREALSEQTHAVYEQGFPIDQQAFETQRQPPPGGEPAKAAEQATLPG